MCASRNADSDHCAADSDPCAADSNYGTTDSDRSGGPTDSRTADGYAGTRLPFTRDRGSVHGWRW